MITTKQPVTLDRFILSVLAGGGFAFFLVSLIAIFTGLGGGKGFSHRAIGGAAGISFISAAVGVWYFKQGDIEYPEWMRKKVRAAQQKPQELHAYEQDPEVEEIEEILQQTLEAFDTNHDIVSAQTVSTDYSFNDPVLRPLEPLTSDENSDGYGGYDSILSPLAPLEVEDENPFELQQDPWG